MKTQQPLSGNMQLTSPARAIQNPIGHAGTDNSNVVPMPGLNSFGGLLSTGSSFTGELCASAALAVFDQLTQPVFMFDQALTICYQNDAADSLLTAGLGIQSEQGALCCAREDEHDALRQICARLPWQRGSDSWVTPPPAEPRTQTLSVGVASSRSTLVLLVRLITLPMQSPVGPAQVGLLQVHSSVRTESGPSPQSLRTAFKLTRAEAAVAMLIANGYAPAEVAGFRNVSVETIRAQLRVLYAKTGTKRQAELVRLVHCMTSLT